jgi:hypothetical protein
MRTDRQADMHGEANMRILVIFSFEIIKFNPEELNCSTFSDDGCTEGEVLSVTICQGLFTV